MFINRVNRLANHFTNLTWICIQDYKLEVEIAREHHRPKHLKFLLLENL